MLRSRRISSIDGGILSQHLSDSSAPNRRGFLGLAASSAMAASLLASYGTFAAFATRFLFPARRPDVGWMVVRPVREIQSGSALPYRTPSGAHVTIARQGESDAVESFVALSSTCPHLGCQVHWEGHNDRFFCPCHNGVFSPSGVALSGPPADSKSNLPTFPLKVERGLLYIEVPFADLKMARQLEAIDSLPRSGPGHDPCLAKGFASESHGVA